MTNQVPRTDRWVLEWAAVPPVAPVVPETEWVCAPSLVVVRVCVCAPVVFDEAEMPVVADAVALLEDRVPGLSGGLMLVEPPTLTKADVPVAGLWACPGSAIEIVWLWSPLLEVVAVWVCAPFDPVVAEKLCVWLGIIVVSSVT